jgi:hypothetical protein
MAKHVYYNPNPTGKSVGDCAIRAIAKTFDLEWGEAFLGLCIAGYLNGDLPNANHIWGAYLKKRGFRWYDSWDSGSEIVQYYWENEQKG